MKNKINKGGIQNLKTKLGGDTYFPSLRKQEGAGHKSVTNIVCCKKTTQDITSEEHI
jgi:hypothetical protein